MTFLCYHTVEPEWASPLAIHPAAFEAHCAWLARSRRVVDIDEALNRTDRNLRLPRGFACLTFDDGFSGVFQHAWPSLVRHRLPATVFLVAKTLTLGGQAVDWVDTPSDGPLVTLTLDQILEMQAAGVSFQSHSYAHLDLTRLSYAECVEDLRESRELLESVLGRAVPFLAYPHGRHDESVRAAAAAAGYTNAFALSEEAEPWGRYAVPRVGLYRGNSARALRLKAAHSYPRMRQSSVYKRVSKVAAQVSAGRGKSQ